MSPSPGLALPSRFDAFVRRFGRLLDECPGEEKIFAEGRDLLAGLVSEDGWLPDRFAASDPATYRQYLLHRDPALRFSVVSFVWGPGQASPIHDHTVWGLIGMLRGAEQCEEFSLDPEGRLIRGPAHRLEPGEIDFVSPRVGDIHRVSNALSDRASVSIHVYGADIGAVRRHVYDFPDLRRDFVSGYSEPGP